MASKRTKKLTRTGVALAIGLSGCGAERVATKSVEPVTTTPAVERSLPARQVDRQALYRSIAQSLDRLRSLELFDVGGVVMNLPDNARSCYGVPCPGDSAGQTAFDQELVRQERRLTSFVSVAERCNSGHCYVFTPETASEAIDALNALQIVTVNALVTTEPKSNPNCYNLPCPQDVEAARAENRRRETLAFTIAGYAKEE